MIAQRLGGIAAGIVAAILLIMAVQFIGNLAWPPPPGLNPRDPVAIAEMLKSMPLLAQLMIPLSYFIGTLGGGAVALRISNGWINALWTVLAVMLAATALNLYVISHPTWLAAACALGPLLGALLARSFRRPI